MKFSRKTVLNTLLNEVGRTIVVKEESALVVAQSVKLLSNTLSLIYDEIQFIQETTLEVSPPTTIAENQKEALISLSEYLNQLIDIVLGNNYPPVLAIGIMFERSLLLAEKITNHSKKAIGGDFYGLNELLATFIDIFSRELNSYNYLVLGDSEVTVQLPRILDISPSAYVPE